MIRAVEALRLPSAKLSPEERTAADTLEKQIDAHVRLHMVRGVLHYDTRETRVPVVTEVQCRIRAAGWKLDVLGLNQRSVVSGKEVTIGYRFMLTPTDEAYRAAEEMIASA